MTDTTTITELPVKRHHRWPEEMKRTLLVCESTSGNEEHVRVCLFCGVKLTTFIPPTHDFRDIYRTWTKPDGTVLPISNFTPPCLDSVSSPVASPCVNQEQQPLKTETLL